ncbi:hypothetical protein BRARA_G03260 [Brassica rapa]|uniref:Nudix hydrolase domain-containing protein n=3 Tax=Brassica TaxID=3705 RepID=A0A397YVJ0_BRACM|nr:nudix hydrolase 21, chloroplastic [Brassica rapa]XP_013649648.1 nudix hydrolase 21, chloroplastic [Brassica napus]KAH0920059.1 hypothetical protein HID58_027719 [Brassica napus]RID56034.1 hypothetical protein BRARA_G03260 [Brassica rapa]CAF2198692.1 unnamed protein product [Brassica napus]CAG7904516.1 unnamed protein product [Brassica rapa]VDD02015.1 unnamed protein product [Brassica rapa]
MTDLYVSLFISNYSPTPIQKVVSLVSRTGRDLQRYDTTGYRQVVGCIPYRYKNDGEIEVLLISAQKKGKGMLLPKGGWEIDESIEEAALRETMEEAGVTGHLEETLGKWQYQSKRHSMVHDGFMFPMLVSEQFEQWPESGFRQRKWVCLSEAIDLCQNWWMREALDAFIDRKCL